MFFLPTTMTDGTSWGKEVVRCRKSTSIFHEATNHEKKTERKGDEASGLSPGYRKIVAKSIWAC
jgi:hypothetical protein